MKTKQSLLFTGTIYHNISANIVKKLFILFLSYLLVGCATQPQLDRCKKYTISGADYPWKPTKFYQSAESQNQLYIEIPKTVQYIPKLEVVDMEFDLPYKINYTFDNVTHRFQVADNHDQYLLYRDSDDDLQKDEVYITCNR